eukprot:gene315-337_t
MRIWSSTSATSTIIELCSGEKNLQSIISMILDFCRTLKRSKKKLARYKHLLRNREDFNVLDACRDFCLHRKSHHTSQDIPENIRRCLETIRLINTISRRILALKNEPIHIYNAEHIELLNQFWSNIFPNRPRSESLISAEWLELGFQGSDPTTDFRSMGVLALIQLVHFSKYRPEAARMILQLFSQTQCYYPFAIIGVNITRFLLDLIDELRIFRLLVENLGHVVAGDLTTYEIMPSDDEVCINFGMTVVHDFYCIIFEEFYLQWVITNPVNVMQFSDIFDMVKASIRRKYAALEAS